jgi:hypothetical protein
MDNDEEVKDEEDIHDIDDEEYNDEEELEEEDPFALTHHAIPVAIQGIINYRRTSRL